MNLVEYRNVPFRIQDLQSVYPNISSLRRKAQHLEESRYIIRLKRGLYVLSPKVSGMQISEFLVANHIHGPSYVSMQSALRHYGLIPERVYETISMTTGIARSYTNDLGQFRYLHVLSGYYSMGVTAKTELGISYMIATPEKALCDLLVYTPNLNIRYKSELYKYLEENLRFDLNELSNFDISLITEIRTVSKKKNMLTQLLKLIEDERNV